MQPEIFRWARVSVGLSVTDVPAMLKRDPEDVAAWEAGTEAPTYPQLETLAYQGHNPAEHLIWKSLSLSTSQPIADQAERIRQQLGITPEKRTGWVSDDSALKGWRKAIEDAGVFVFTSTAGRSDG
ncbi:hypothetical protein [Thiocapsa sp.]|uniref:hypothetical protein n=1 Tax=Thiocapsa sp. TaxID=2024551 RepID=UPI003593015C